jgi:hypothetical protein
MKKILPLILVSLVPFSTFAEDPACLDKTSYGCYQENVKNFCDAPEFDWNKDSNDLGMSLSKYSAISNITNLIPTLETSASTDEAKSKLKKDLVGLQNKTYAGFSSLETSRLQYRTTMDGFFACAVVASRSEKITKLEQLIDKKYPAKASDIRNKIKKEKERYERLKNQMRCQLNTGADETKKMIDKLSNSATKEYCHFTFYMTYLGENVRNNFTKMQEIEKSLKTEDIGRSSRSTDEALQDMTRKAQSIDAEIARARDTLPKALVAYREMERTYTVHLLLVIIYDDYLTLRNQLSDYMSAVSQLYEKAFNAQDANKR